MGAGSALSRRATHRGLVQSSTFRGASRSTNSCTLKHCVRVCARCARRAHTVPLHAASRYRAARCTPTNVTLRSVERGAHTSPQHTTTLCNQSIPLNHRFGGFPNTPLCTKVVKWFRTYTLHVTSLIPLYAHVRRLCALRTYPTVTCRVLVPRGALYTNYHVTLRSVQQGI